MISVENFYHVLYANLLGPAGLDCCYYYPFGTTQCLIQDEGHAWRPKHDNHVLFHYDQEPLWTRSLGYEYDDRQSFYSTKICKLLANSEHSDLKKSICQERSMLDWYFFYHGFASRDWFRDARYLGNMYEPKQVFCSLNHIIGDKRSYRTALTARIIREGLLDQGDVSFHGTKQACLAEINSPFTKLSDSDKKLIQKHICENSVQLPLTVDHTVVNGSFSAKFGHQEYQLWQNSFWHVVNETVFYDAKLHLTEKTFKPIVALRPFVLVAAPGNLHYLRSYGFQTFDDWIDESYDEIVDNDQRLEAITREIGRLCTLSCGQLREMLHDMSAVLTHNKRHFFGELQHIIVDELVDNFDSCVRVWNNGRVDPDRTIPYRYDLGQVKKIFKQ